MESEKYVLIVKNPNEKASIPGTKNNVYYLSTLVTVISVLCRHLQYSSCCFDLPSDVMLAV